MHAYFRQPVVALAVLGALSGALGATFFGVNYGTAPHPGLYMVLTGVWFGIVIGFATWRWANPTAIAVATAALATWIGWELAVNVALQIDASWPGTGPVSGARPYIEGLAAGAVGAFAIWAGMAAFTPVLRRGSQAAMIVSTGALFGLLLPWTNSFDSGAILLLPWQAAVAAMIGLNLAPAPRESAPLQA